MDVKDYNLFVKLAIDLDLNRRVDFVRRPLSLVNYSPGSDDSKEDK